MRNIAAQEGVNLADVQGTGAQGRVTKDDIMAYIEQRKAAAVFKFSLSWFVAK